MTSGVDKEQRAMDTCVLNIAITLRRKFLAKICAVLVLHNVSIVPTVSNRTRYLDVFDDRVPAVEKHIKIDVDRKTR